MFPLTQVLSGHGCFHRMCRASNADGFYCGHLEETVEHILFDCLYWEPSRSEAEEFAGSRNITPWCDIQDILCGPGRRAAQA